jgi:hypothetical protein
MVSIPYPAKTATVTVPGGLSAAALVLALMQNSVSGVWMAGAVPNTSTGKDDDQLEQGAGVGHRTEDCEGGLGRRELTQTRSDRCAALLQLVPPLCDAMNPTSSWYVLDVQLMLGK